MQQELQAEMDQLPETRNQAWKFHSPGGEAHLPPPSSLGQQVNSLENLQYACQVNQLTNPWSLNVADGSHCFLPTRENRQRHQELLEHPSEEKAKEARRRTGGRHRRLLQPSANCQRPVGEKTPNRHKHGEASSAGGSVHGKAELPLRGQAYPGHPLLRIPAPSSSTYASSTENISRLLEKLGEEVTQIRRDHPPLGRVVIKRGDGCERHE
ncbi:hypothetical protein HPP92_011064 [Vanilla planifolia]|uniref:Uncharacterized protein n=1 Tax=Vanilla planifolia TaxID=51239 RepID=A0A835V432_VANPL|nr:hypothetical protein HPP92_011064 [Vanilla planifolia]